MISHHATSYIGTPFRHQGRRPGRGLDCAGVIVCALRAMGRRVEDTRNYRKIPPRGLLRESFQRNGFNCVSGAPRNSDLLLFWIRDKRLEIHCGVVVEGGFVHVEDGGCVEFSLLDGWRRQLAAVLRLGGCN